MVRSSKVTEGSGKDMSSDDNTRTGIQFRYAGPGMHINFRCARCNLSRPILGRKVLSRQGVKLMVCRHCVEKQ